MKNKFLRKITISLFIAITFCMLTMNKSNAMDFKNIFNYSIFNKIKEINNDINRIVPKIKSNVISNSSDNLDVDGYENIHISSVTGRQFKEYRQNIDGWESKYPITHLSGVWSSGWKSECGSVSIITLGSGYTERATFSDLKNKLESTNGNTDIDGWIYSYTGQYPNWSSSYSSDYIANKLSSGAVGILHSTSSLVSSSGTHYMTLLDVNEDKTKVYLSNPWMGSNYQGWITFEQLSYIFDSIGFIDNIGVKPNYINNEIDETVGAEQSNNIKENKIFYIGDSWMEDLREYEISESSRSYFFAENSRNADWVLDNYYDLDIPDDASCIVIEFGLNDYTNWDETQELADKLANDYKDKEIFILRTPHVCSGYSYPSNFNSQVDIYNEHMKNYCEGKERITFIDPTITIVENNGNGYLKDEYAADQYDTDLGGGKMHLSYRGYQTWYEDIIKGINNAMTEKTKLSEIKIKQAPSKTEYIEGEDFNRSGMKIEAVYNNGTTKEITNYTVINENNLKVTQTSVTISYTEDGVTKTVEQKIKVNKKETLKIESKTYEITEENNTKYIEKIMPNTSIEKFKKQIETNGTIKIYINKEEINNKDNLITTGAEIIVNFNNTETKYIAVVIGDLVGNGIIDNVNMLKLARYNAKIDLDLKDAYLKAADIYRDGEYGNIKDLLKMARVLAKIEDI